MQGGGGSSDSHNVCKYQISLIFYVFCGCFVRYYIHFCEYQFFFNILCIQWRFCDPNYLAANTMIATVDDLLWWTYFPSQQITFSGGYLVMDHMTITVTQFCCSELDILYRYQEITNQLLYFSNCCTCFMENEDADFVAILC